MLADNFRAAMATTLVRWRRTAMARKLERQLAALVYGQKTGTASRGEAVVDSTVVTQLIRGRGVHGAAALAKRMDRAIKPAAVTACKADWIWSWVKDEQQANRLTCDIQRGTRGGGGRPGWRAENSDKSQWAQYTRRVLRAVTRMAGESRVLSTGQVEAVRQATKGALPPECRGHGSDMFRAALWWTTVNAGMTINEQETKVTIGGRWWSEQWWDGVAQAAHQMMKDGVMELSRVVLGWHRARQGAQERRCVVHWCAGTGEGVRRAATAIGLEVIEVENDSRLLARKAEEADDNVLIAPVDLTKIAGAWWREAVAAATGTTVADQVAHVGGPPCDSFAHSDASNARGRHRQFNKRDHAAIERGKRTRPPAHPEGSRLGDEARAGDYLAQSMLEMMMSCRRPWMMENPEAYLRCRPYMQKAEALMRTVDYCAYLNEEEAAEAVIQKRTNVWTNVDSWIMKGRTGDGRCRGRCGYPHGSLEDVKDKRLRNRHPQALIEEFLSAGLVTEAECPQ